MIIRINTLLRLIYYVKTKNFLFYQTRHNKAYYQTTFYFTKFLKAMKKQIIPVLIACLFLIGINQVVAQDEAKAATDTTSLWKKSGSVGLNFANVGLENWAGGGVSSVSVGFIGNYKATRESDVTVWSHQLDLAYGVLKQRGNDSFRKTDDQFIYLSQYGYKLSEKWLITGGLNFRTQLAPGYEYGTDANGDETRDKISNLLSPGYLSINTGITYKHKDIFTATFSPATLKNTFVLDDGVDETSFGLDAGKTSRSEFGMSLLSSVNVKVMENVNFSSNLSLFASYEALGEIDVNWEALIAMKINKYLNASFGTQLIYDEDIAINGVNSKVQFKHALSIGLGLTF